MAINWNLRSYTEEQFVEAWQNSYSISEVAGKLGLNKSGGSVTLLSKTAIFLELSKDHFGRTTTPRKFTLEEILVKDSPIRGDVELRKKLVKAGLKENRCEKCNRTEWEGEAIPLSLDHENGINTDNRLENLRVLCLNCHGLTPTWCGKNKVRRTFNGNLPKYNPGEKPVNSCKCGSEISDQAEQCIRCSNKIIRGIAAITQPKINWPSIDEIFVNIQKMGYAKYGTVLGVSDNSIRAHLKRHGVDMLPKKVYTKNNN